MNLPCPSPHREKERAVALILVLAFIVLLTGLTVAFFSSSLLYRQISNSSASEAKVDLFVQGAVDTIVGDLKQEIAAGSNATLYTDTNGNVVSGFYRPTKPITAVPALALAGASGITTFAPNLVKRSAYGQAFFPSGSSTGYNDTNTSESILPSATPSSAPPTAPVRSPSNRAANVSTITPSVNGRSFSLARWNKALLVQKATYTTKGSTDTNDTDFTPDPAVFAPPDWVLTARDGSNPTGAFNSSMVNSPGQATSVIGRYAYTIYDEGGLLDANVVGCPRNAFGAADPVTAYKNAVAFADLTQLPGINNLATARQTAVINCLVGWRNYATAQPNSGSLALGFNFTGSPLLRYSAAVTGNLNGFLRTSNTGLVNGQTDRMFSNRQEMMRLLLNAIASQAATTAGQTERANVQNSLQYLGTFSRSLSQPSFAPNLTRPKVLHNASSSNPAVGENDSYQPSPNNADDKINPALLSVRVTSTGWTRNNGSTPIIGEPLIKKRFALNRLAWLSYKGPAANNLGDSVVQQTITQLGGVPANTTADPVYQFVAQGTDDGTSNTNIPKYFGLTWDDTNKRWKYIHGISGSSGRIMTLTEVAAANREPDFFELLKASIAVGSLGKGYVYNAPSTPPSTTHPDATYPPDYQQQRDSSVDAQVMQIGANIIDQFDCDSYPTRILFSDNSLFHGVPQEYRGIEDLPYLYRVREGRITLRDSVPSQTNLPSISSTTPTDPGLYAITQEPEIWNPHGWSSSSTDLGFRPTSLRLVALSTDPNSASSVPNGTSSAATSVTAGAYCLVWSGTSFGGAIPNTKVGTNAPGPAWNEQTTEIDFNVPTGKLYLYREPTLLIKPGVPDASVQIGASNMIKSVQGTNYLTSQWPATQIQVDSPSAPSAIVDNKQYIGILAGYGPVAWAATVPTQGISSTSPATATPGIVEITSTYLPTVIKGITYRLQYKDPSGNWLTYDEKFCDYVHASSYNNGAFWTDLNRTFNTYNSSASVPTEDNLISTEFAEVCFDPRTSRFGMQPQGPNGYRGGYWDQFPLRQSVLKVGWAAGTDTTGNLFHGAIAQLALATERPDDNAGFSLGGGGISFNNVGPTAPGWFPSTGSGIVIEPGMFCQNNPVENSNPTNKKEVSTDPQTVGTTLNQYFADADGVIRRSMSGYVPTDNTNPATPPASGQPSGLPLKTAFSFTYGSGTTTTTTNSEISSRPLVLNRPFRSPAELGYVFSGTPWRNLDMSTPESGSVALMDVFCTNDTDNPDGLVSGKVNLNARPSVDTTQNPSVLRNPVLKAILAGTPGAYKDELSPTTSTIAPAFTSTDAPNVVAALAARTTGSASNQGPLMNVSELAGKWGNITPLQQVTSPSGSVATIGSASYVGFSDTDLSTALAANTTTGASEQRVARFREAAIRPLAGVGQVRTWNLMIDLVAQTGRYSASAGSAASPLAAFVVEGEQRYWIHLAIDRVSGQVVDKQVEIVKE